MLYAPLQYIMDSLTCFFTFLILTNFSIIVLGLDRWWCHDNGTYTTNSTYHNNLKTLLSSLSSNIDDNGFGKMNLGQQPDQVYATAFCRGDTQLHDCMTCVQNASAEMLDRCPNIKQAIAWRHPCMVRYSDDTVVGRREDGQPIILMNTGNFSSPVEVDRVMNTLFAELRSQSISGGSLMKIAVGNTTGPDLMTIFSLLQCTPDLSKQECEACLIKSQGFISSCCLDTTGIRCVVPSCYFQYEVEPFYNISRIQEVQRMLSISVPTAPVPVLTAPVPEPTAPVPEPHVHLTPGNRDNSKARTIIIVIVAIISCLILLAGVIVLSKRRKKRRKQTVAFDDELSTVESLQYDFNKIKEATNDFSDANKLGKGGFGAVYKGKLQNSQEIAVKRLFRGSRQGDLEFRNEIMLLAKLQHRNLVRLFGFARDGTERVLVYEFVKNGSLDNFLFDQTQAHSIGWETRFKIIGGIAKGLLYLHQDSRLRVIHRDLKASNILLDTTINPKIADFGTARLCETDESEDNTRRIVGTYGYMPPEYVNQGRFSIKTDVYSFGVLVLEIISGQKNSNFQNEGLTSEESLLNFAWRNWQGGTIINLIDPVLRPAQDCFHEIKRCAHIALLCIQENTSDRPTMASVGHMLSSLTTTLVMPSWPAFFVPHTSNQDGSLLNKDAELARQTQLSENDASITSLHPR